MRRLPGTIQALLLLPAVAALGACGDEQASADDRPAPYPIHAVQGPGPISPLDGQVVSVRGIVTGDFQGEARLGGFFLQGESDGDERTSDGVFVFDGKDPEVDVSPGDRVDVTGTVTEYFGETQIVAQAVAVAGRGEVRAVPVTLPVAGLVINADGQQIANLEPYEGMLVSFPQTLTVSDLRNLGRYGELRLAESGRPYAYTNDNPPNAAGYAAFLEQFVSGGILVDDGRRAVHPTPIRFLKTGTASDSSIRIGDRVTGLTGNLRYSRASGESGIETWRLVPSDNPSFSADALRSEDPTIPGRLRVASFNLFNYFTTVDPGRRVCGPLQSGSCRGADSKAELLRQQAKLVAGLRHIDADVVGLVELENNTRESLASLVDALNGDGEPTYDYVDTGTIGKDSIKVGLIYKPESVTPRGRHAILDRAADSRYNDRRNRPVLAQTFVENRSTAILTVAVTHLKSKGSPCDEDGDPDLADGQGNCNRTRTLAAEVMAEWLAGGPTGSGDPDVLIIGDLNAYPREDPIVALESAGYRRLAPDGDAARSYSYVFRGRSGALDHALVSGTLAAQVDGFLEWHINADAPPVLDYNLESDRDPALFDPDTPFRSSDHDPLIVGLSLTAAATPSP